MSHDEIRELLGAFALDAVDGEEAREVERHLRTCPGCAREVAEHRDSASLLQADAPPAPDRVWERIAADIEPKRGPAASPWRRRVSAIAAAAAVVTIAVLGIRVVEQGRDLRDVRVDVALARAAEAAEREPGAIQLGLRSEDGTVVAEAVLLRDGTGFLRPAAMPALRETRTYQLWALDGGRRISAGVIGARPEVVAFRVAPNIDGLAITDEPAGGVDASRQTPVAFAEISIA